MRLRCPHCHGTQHWKWNSPSWMFFTPGPMENQRCSECGREYAVWFGVFTLRHVSARRFCRVWHWSALVVFFSAVALLLPLFMR